MHHSRLWLNATFQQADLNGHLAKKAQWCGMVSLISYQTMGSFLLLACLCPFLLFVRVPFSPHIPSILQVPGSKGKLELMYCCSQQRMDFSRVHRSDPGCSLLPWLLFLGSSWLFIWSHLQCLLFAFCSLGASLMRMYKVQVVTPVWEAGSVSWVMTVNSTLETSVHTAVSATRLIPNNVPDH